MELSVENVGPVSRLVLAIPEGGGVVVLRGPNGCGKSTVLDAAQSLIRGKGSLEARDGTARGVVEGWGARITVGRQTRRTGELEVVSLEGRLDIAQLVDPGIADPSAADARRIKALATLTGAGICYARFASLFSCADEFERVIPATSIPDDLVEAAGKIKRAAEAEARKREERAEGLAAKAAGLTAACAGVDTSAEADHAVLQSALEKAIMDNAEARSRRNTADEAQARAATARAALESAGSVTEQLAEERERLHRATENRNSIIAESDRMRNEIAKLQEQLGTLAKHEQRHLATMEAATNQIATLVRTQAAIDGWRETIERAAETTGPDDAALQAASDNVTEARRAVECGAVVRNAISNRKQAAALQAEAKAVAAEAEHLRDAAKGTDDVLSEAVACDLLRVEAGRLVTDTRRGMTLFADLSHGERWAIALRLAAQRVGPSGVIPVPQEAWEGLDPDNRAMIAALAKELGVVILTAEADSGELRAEPF